MARTISSSKRFLVLAMTFVLLITLAFHHSLKTCFGPAIPVVLLNTKIQPVSKIEMTINKTFTHIDQRIPKIKVTDRSNTTSAKNSKVYLKNPKNSYCVGDHLTIRVDMFDYSGKKKTYGGDFLRARISTPELEAGASGRIEDFNNGSYHVHFILFWEGKVNIEVLLMHPSEGASALWTFRNKWHGYVDHLGKFINPQGQSEVECGFDLDKKQELCPISELEFQEIFIK